MRVDRTRDRRDPERDPDRREPRDPAGGAEGHEGEPTQPRASASLILLRDSDHGAEVLLVRRNPEQRFMGGAWVFPGGAAHPEDRDERHTARRELEEEAAICIGEDVELHRFSRWITPARVKVRFDTHFFVARAPQGAQATPDGGECVGARWLRPRDALDAGARGELMLVFPTVRHLEQFAEHGSVSEALRSAASRRVQPVEPRVIVEGGAAQVLLPGEPGYKC